MLLAFLLVFLSLVSATQIPVTATIVNYTDLPSCAKSCKIVNTSEKNCMPPLAPLAPVATYKDCFCQSEHLRSLHKSGDICQDFCNKEDALAIHEYYGVICGMKHPMPSSSFATSTTVTPSTSTSSSSTSAAIPTIRSPLPSSSENGSTDGRETWLQKNWRLLLIPASLMISISIVLFAAVYYRRRRHHQMKPAVRSKRTRQPRIPLRTIPSSSNDPLRSEDQPYWPSRPRSTIGSSFPDLRSPTICSPLDSPSAIYVPGANYSFSNSLGDYGEEVREELARGRGGSGTNLGTPGRSREDMERLIGQRLRTTRRPDISLGQTSRTNFGITFHPTLRDVSTLSLENTASPRSTLVIPNNDTDWNTSHPAYRLQDGEPIPVSQGWTFVRD